MKKRDKLILALIVPLIGAGALYYYYTNHTKLHFDDDADIVYGKISEELTEEELLEIGPYKAIALIDVQGDLRTGREAFLLRMAELQENSGVPGGELTEEKEGLLDVYTYDFGFNVANVKYKEENGEFVKAEFSNIYDNSEPSDIDPYINEEMMKSIINNIVYLCIPKEDFSEETFGIFYKDLCEMIDYQLIKDTVYKYGDYTVRFKIKPLDMDSTKTFVLLEVYK